MGRHGCLLLVLGAVLGACMDQPPLTVDKPAVDLPRGAGTDLVVMQDGRPFPLQDLVWLVDDDTIVTVTRTSDGERLRISASSEGATAIHVGSHGLVVDIPTHVSPPAYVQLWIEPAFVTTTIGAVVPMHATAVDTTNTIRDVSDLTGWQLMDTDIATIDANMVHGMRSGQTTQQAVVDDVSAAVPVTVY